MPPDVVEHPRAVVGGRPFLSSDPPWLSPLGREPPTRGFWSRAPSQPNHQNHRHGRAAHPTNAVHCVTLPTGVIPVCETVTDKSTNKRQMQAKSLGRPTVTVRSIHSPRRTQQSGLGIGGLRHHVLPVTIGAPQRHPVGKRRQCLDVTARQPHEPSDLRGLIR